jgi:hypothetical protein
MVCGVANLGDPFPGRLAGWDGVRCFRWNGCLSKHRLLEILERARWCHWNGQADVCWEDFYQVGLTMVWIRGIFETRIAGMHFNLSSGATSRAEVIWHAGREAEQGAEFLAISLRSRRTRVGLVSWLLGEVLTRCSTESIRDSVMLFWREYDHHGRAFELLEEGFSSSHDHATAVAQQDGMYIGRVSCCPVARG